MTGSAASTEQAGPHASIPLRWGFGGLAAAWYALTTVTPLGLPNSVVVVVLGLLVALSVEPDSRFPRRGVAASGRNLVLTVLAVAAFVPVAAGSDMLRGVTPIEIRQAILASAATVCMLLPRLAQTRPSARPPVLGHRELILSVTALVALTRSYQAGDLWLAMTAFAVTAPVVMAVRRVRRGTGSPRRLVRGPWALQAANLWLLLSLAGATALLGSLFLWHVYTPEAQPVVVAAFWTGLAATAVLAAFPRRRVSVTANALVAMSSVFLVVQLVRLTGGPSEAVVIGRPFDEEWTVVNGGPSTLVNAHRTFGVERDAIDLVQFADGRTHRGDRSRLDNFPIFGDRLLAVADGRVTAALDTLPDLPVGRRTWHDMAGNHVILDIGGGRYVLYGHLQQGSLRVQVGDDVRRGQVIGLVGDSGSSDEPHLHLQVQNTPTVDVEDRTMRTSPILFDDVTVADVRRGDTVGPGTEPAPR